MAEGLAALSPDTVLVRAPELKLRLSDDEVLRVETDGGQVALPSVALSLLAMFERPMAVGEALGSVAASRLDELGMSPAHRTLLRDSIRNYCREALASHRAFEAGLPRISDDDVIGFYLRYYAQPIRCFLRRDRD